MRRWLKAEKWLGIAGVILSFLVISGVITVTGFIGWKMPLPSQTTRYVHVDGSEHTLTAKAPRWPFVVGFPAMSLTVLFFVDGVRNQRAIQLSDRSEALKQLSWERRIGVGLRNTGWHNTPEDQMSEWWERVQRWQETVKSRMNSIHPADAENLSTLGDVNLQTFEGVRDRVMTLRLSMLGQLCDKLRIHINDRTMP